MMVMIADGKIPVPSIIIQMYSHTIISEAEIYVHSLQSITNDSQKFPGEFVEFIQ